MSDRRITIRLPAGHPIWDYPAGDRSAKLKAFIDLGMSLGEKLDRIEDKLNNFSPTVTPTISDNTPTSKISFDTEAFQNL